MRSSACPPGRMRFSFGSRCRVVGLILDGESPRQAAACCGASRATGYRLWARDREGGWAALADRPCTPRRQPRRLSVAAEQEILHWREHLAAGPLVLAAAVGRPPSTVGKVPRRAGRSRLPRPIRDPRVRYERAKPGELLHVDAKKLGRFFQVGKRILADGVHRSPRAGRQHLHVAIDDHSRVAYCELLASERKEDCCASSSGPTPGTPNTASPRSACCPTTRTPTTPTPGATPVPNLRSGAATPAPTRPRQTGRQKRRSRRCSANRHTASPTPPAHTAPEPSPATSASTTDADPTARPEANRRSAVSHTSVVTTPSRAAGGATAAPPPG